MPHLSVNPLLGVSLGLAIAMVACSNTTTTQSRRDAHQNELPAAPPPPTAVKDVPVRSSPSAPAAHDLRLQEAETAPEVRQLDRAGRTAAAAELKAHAGQRDRFGDDSLTVLRPPSQPVDRENYAHLDENPVRRVAEHPVSTFSIDVDTGAYANVRRFLNNGRLPIQDAVRVEEMINYFSYAYPLPADRQRPFNIVTEAGPTPWNPATRLLHVGIKGFDVPVHQRPAANLVFLVDVSGSMRAANKLDLLKSSLRLLSRHLSERDRVSLVVYAGGTGIVLEPTPGNERLKIETALAGLTAGGRTNGAAGIALAYAMARRGYIDDGINRVLLATDGDFNVGTVNYEALEDLVERERESGVSLTTLGFGTGNYNDHLMEQLADAGNGNYAYIDTLNEAQKVLVDELASMLQTIAKDVKIQIEFNPAVVAEYRLIGYENRMLKREDFNNDQIDAGEIGAGHTVTVLYELALVGSQGALVDPLRYRGVGPESNTGSDELAFLRLRYKDPNGGASKLIEQALSTRELRSSLTQTSSAFRFSAAVAAFGQLLKGATYTSNFNYDQVLELARGARQDDRFGYRGEFLSLINLARSLDHKG